MIPIPDRMSHLDRDHRGYAIPWGVYRDKDNRAHFQINDEEKRIKALRDDLCPLCGKKLLRGRWFVGGPLSAFHRLGVYIDPPMHSECVHYALQACPYLAAPHYSKRIDDKTLSPSTRPALLVDRTMIDERPTVFVCVMATRQKITYNSFSPRVAPIKPFLRIEYWRHGQQLSKDEGEDLVAINRLSDIRQAIAQKDKRKEKRLGE